MNASLMTRTEQLRLLRADVRKMVAESGIGIEFNFDAWLEASGDAEALRLYERLEGTVSLKVNRRSGNLP